MKSLSTKRHFHLLMKMTLTNVLLNSLLITGYAEPVLGQLLKRTVTIAAANTGIEKIRADMEEQAQVKFSYPYKAVDARKKIDLQGQGAIESVLRQLFGNRVKVPEFGNHIFLLKAIEPVVDEDGVVLRLLVNKVKGIVYDETGQPMPGVNVVEKGTGKGTITDVNGAYALDVTDENAVLVFSSIGYLTQEIQVAGRTTINVNFETDVKKLEEVVVVGYGTTKAKDLTGSVASVSSENFNKGVIATPDQLLQGRTAGVTITPSSGEPGAAVTVNIRGTSSIRGNNDPLYVIDGIPVETGQGLGARLQGGSASPRNPLSFLNPNDIESITVLKDASSAAIYGSRGANGVILVTTKKGKSENRRGDFTYSAYGSISTIAKKYDLLEAPAFLTALKKANIDAGVSEQVAEQSIQPGSDLNKGANMDWQNEVLRTGFSNGHNLGWSFSRGKTSVRVSGSYDDQTGIIKNSGLTRLTGRVNLSQKLLDDKLTIDVSATLGNVKNAYSTNVFEYAIQYNPTYPIYNPDGTFFAPAWGIGNPIEMLTYISDNDNVRRFLNNNAVSYEFMKGLVYKASLGYDNSYGLRKTFGDPRLNPASFGGQLQVFDQDIPNSTMSGNGRAIYERLKNISLLTEHTLTYDKKIGHHAITALAGYSYQNFTSERSTEAGFGLRTPVTSTSDNFIKDIDNFLYRLTVDPLPSYTIVKLQSVFGRVNYSMNNKYFFTATFRVDGSSKFGQGNQYGAFPAFAMKWKVLNEGFAKGLSKTFFDLSLRANWGKLGSQDGLGAYDALDISTQWEGKTRLDHQGNKKLKWEVATTTGIGLDWALAGNRLSGTIDYFHTKRENLLFFGPVPGGFSASSNYFSNLTGNVINQGLEFSFLAEAVQQKNFNWNINYNMTFFRNTLENFDRIVNTGAVRGQGLSGAYAQTFANGFPLFAWNLPLFEGFDEQGFSTYADGGNHLYHSALPTFTAGLTNNFNYKNWDLSVFLNTSRGFYVYNNTANTLFIKGSLKTAHNVTQEVAFSKENPLNSNAVSSRFVEKGDFIRLSNITLSYTFALKNAFLKTISVTMSGQNLALWTKYSGLDPEINTDANISGVPSRGFDFHSYPKAKTVTFGLNIGF